MKEKHQRYRFFLDLGIHDFLVYFVELEVRVAWLPINKDVVFEVFSEACRATQNIRQSKFSTGHPKLTWDELSAFMGLMHYGSDLDQVSIN